jgi:DNA polymerase-1
MDKILLIDGHNSIWRANIGFKPKDADAPLYNIVYNFFRSLRASVEQFEPNKVFFCLEGHNNFRYKLFSEYKANRIIKTGSKAQTISDDFHRQKDIILALLPHLPIIKVKADEFEADDVIATLAENLKDEDITVISNDSDFIQLLQKGYKNFKIFNPFKKEYIEAPSYHYLAWKSLRGDKKTDNIPGLVGDKKAQKLLGDPIAFKEFLSSEENRANFSLNKELIELKIIDDGDLIFTEYKINFELLKEEFNNMDFQSIIEEEYWNRFCKTFSNLR